MNKIKIDLLLEKILAKDDFDQPVSSRPALNLISRTNDNNHLATFIFVPWQSGRLIQTWIMKQVPKKYDVYSISPNALLMRDPGKTSRQCLKVCSGATQLVEEVLAREEYTEFNVIGLSVGTGIAAYVANRIERPKRVDFVCPGAELSTALWLGSRTEKLRRDYQAQGYNLEQLQKLWADFDLINNLDSLKDVPISITYSESDTVIVPDQAREVVAKLNKMGVKDIRLKKNRFLGHYLTMFWVWLTWRLNYLD